MLLSAAEGDELLFQDVLELWKGWSFFLSRLPELLFQGLELFPELGLNGPKRIDAHWPKKSFSIGWPSSVLLAAL